MGESLERERGSERERVSEAEREREGGRVRGPSLTSCLRGPRRSCSRAMSSPLAPLKDERRMSEE